MEFKDSSNSEEFPNSPERTNVVATFASFMALRVMILILNNKTIKRHCFNGVKIHMDGWIVGCVEEAAIFRKFTINLDI
jgi:hypothetical protein